MATIQRSVITTKTFAISSFSNKFAKDPSPLPIRWKQFVEALTTHDERDSKDGPTWSPTQYKPGYTRSNEGVAIISMVVCDGDDGRLPEPISQRLQDAGLAHIVHSTYSHTEAHPKWRVIVPLDPVVNAEVWSELWPRLTAHLFDDAADTAASDPSRMYYLPACPPGVARFADHHDGEAFDVASLPPLPPQASSNGVVPAGTPVPSKDVPAGASVLSDDVVLELMFGAKNGDKAKRLFDGDDSMHEGDTSAADLALCNNLAFWTSRDLAQMDRLFRQSQRLRPKWNKQHYADGRTYGQATLTKAITETTDTYGASDIQFTVNATPTADDGPPAETTAYHRTDLGNAERLAAQHGHNLRYCRPWKSWLAWTGTHWREDGGEVMRFAMKTVRSIYQEAADAEDSGERKALATHATASESAHRLKALVSLAQDVEGLPVTPDELDQSPWLLNVNNGTLDLRTGQLREHCRDDLVTRVVDLDYDPQATCPRWETFLQEIFDSDAELIRFIQRAVGYFLTGDTREQVLFIFHGSGSNGKSTFLGILQAILGAYALQTAHDLLISKRNDIHPTVIADLFGKRLAIATEADEGRRLNESLVKALTGSDRISARKMHRDAFEFTPTHKLVLAANHKPDVRGSDHAIWRRIRLVPFNVTFRGDAIDGDLSATLQAELPGVLRWAVAGCLAWQRDGLGEPAAVQEATTAYRSENDIVSEFLTDEFVREPDARVSAEQLWAGYEGWCFRNGEKKLPRKALVSRIKQLGCERRRSTGGRRYWFGLRFRGQVR